MEQYIIKTFEKMSNLSDKQHLDRCQVHLGSKDHKACTLLHVMLCLIMYELEDRLAKGAAQNVSQNAPFKRLRGFISDHSAL